MFKPEDFELPMEKLLRLRVIKDEVDHCEDKEMLRNSLKSCAESLMRYQHLLAVTLEETMRRDLERLAGEAVKILEDT